MTTERKLIVPSLSEQNFVDLNGHFAQLRVHRAKDVVGHGSRSTIGGSIASLSQVAHTFAGVSGAGIGMKIITPSKDEVGNHVDFVFAQSFLRLGLNWGGLSYFHVGIGHRYVRPARIFKLMLGPFELYASHIRPTRRASQ